MSFNPPSSTVIDELATLKIIEPLLLREEDVEFNVDEHLLYLMKPLLAPLPPTFTSLAASQPWIVYWILQSLDLLKNSLKDVINEDLSNSIIKTLESCSSLLGGFGGGPGQMPHVACTFAAINSFIILDEVNLIEVDKVLTFLRNLFNRNNGSFRVSEGGESDCRAIYCALSTATLLGGMDFLFEGGQNDIQKCLDFISSCQSFDGGFGATPSTEGHMGYSYCALASICILLEYSSKKGWNNISIHGKIDLLSLFRWAQSLQCPITNGFRGRTHKLVDGCYSFWGGSLFALGRRVALLEGSKLPKQLFMMPNPEGLQNFILKCCQSGNDACGGGGGGGLRDKPGKYLFI